MKVLCLIYTISVIPGVVYTNDSTEIKLISYTKIIPFLVEAIKEQQTMIDSLNHSIIKLTSDGSNNLKSGLVITNDDLKEEADKPILF